jgi:hypothetical protein
MGFTQRWTWPSATRLRVRSNQSLRREPGRNPGNMGSTQRSLSDRKEIGASTVDSHGSRSRSAMIGTVNVSGWLTAASAPRIVARISS